MKKIFIVLILSVFSRLIFGQINLVPNPDFEIYNLCPTTVSSLYLLADWVSPSTGSPDFYSSCNNTSSSPFVSVPQNMFGYQSSCHNGDGYVGLIIYQDQPALPNEYREYVQVKLTNALVAGQKYYANCWVSLAEYSMFATDDFGIHITQNPININPNQFPGAFGLTPTISNPQNQFLTDKTNWKRISGSFVATGGEEYITIGNFKSDTNTDTMTLTSIGPPGYAYYYIDHVCLSIDSNVCNEQEIITKIPEIKTSQNSFYSSGSNLYINEIGSYKISIYNTYGILIKEGVFSDFNTIDLSSIKSGCYVVTVETSTKVIREKLYIVH